MSEHSENHTYAEPEPVGEGDGWAIAELDAEGLVVAEFWYATEAAARAAYAMLTE
jgi:hypothetical protein